MTEHVPDPILAAYARDPGTHREIEAHLSSCEECRQTANTDRALAVGMSHRETWRLAEEIMNRRGQFDARNFKDRMDAEDLEAEQMLEPVLKTPYSLTHANIATKPRFRTGGVVRKLMTAALDQCHKDPKYALALAATGQLISAQLPASNYSAAEIHDLQGNALKDLATVYRYLGNFAEARRALARAEEAFKELSDEGMGLAAVKHARAQLLNAQQRNPEALSLAHEAAQEYAERDETMSHTETMETIAAIHHDSGDISKAQAIYRSVFHSADVLDNPEMKARSAKALGIIARDSGDFGAASRYFLEALQLYQAMGKDAMVIRMKWSICRLALMTGNARDCSVRLLEIRSALADKGMAHDAAEVDLDRAEAHLILEEFELARSICATLPETFIQANMLRGALTAAAYLKEAAASGRVTRRDFQHVRRYLAELTKQPELAFAPPPESR